MAKAAVCTGIDAPLEIRDDIDVAPPGEGEVRVRMAASGVCHSDLSVCNGTIPLPMPIVLGHEGAGVVEEVGPGVSRVKEGDHIVVSWVPQCGQCYFCKRGEGFLCDMGASAMTGGMVDGTTRFSSGGSPLFQMAMAGTFANSAIIPEVSAVKIPDDIDLEAAALIGCGVLTGVGAALNTANVREGDVVAVIGCGGVGLNVIQGAKIAGAKEIVAVDMLPFKLDLATQFGATQTVNAADVDPVSAVMDVTGQRGADVSFEVIGLGPTMEQAINMIRKGGEAVIVGVPRMDTVLSLPAAFSLVYTAKTIKGCWYGSSNVHTDVPKLIEYYRTGELKLDELISRRIGLDEVNDAFDAMKTGEVARSVIHHEH